MNGQLHVRRARLHQPEDQRVLFGPLAQHSAESLALILFADTTIFIAQPVPKAIKAAPAAMMCALASSFATASHTKPLGAFAGVGRAGTAVAYRLLTGWEKC